MSVDKFRMGEPFYEPESPEELEFFTAWFFGRIKTIVSTENHILKWRGVDNIIELLDQAISELDLDIKIIHENGFWYLDCNADDFLNLPIVAKKFGKLYRFQRGQNKDLKEILDARVYKKIDRNRNG